MKDAYIKIEYISISIGDITNINSISQSTRSMNRNTSISIGIYQFINRDIFICKNRYIFI